MSAPNIREARRTFPVLGTFATVIISAPEEDIPSMLFSADSLLRHLDLELGRFSETGQLHRLNSGNEIPSNTELGSLVLLSDSIVSATSGWFDPSLGVVSLVWGFPEAESIPSPEDIEAALAQAGWADVVHIETGSISTDPGSYLDFGAVAKGWAVDRTYLLLRGMGAEECLVEVGGEIRCGSSTGRIWNLGVRHPRDEQLAGILSITEGAVATSGDYECYFVADGIRYSHLIDGSTGYPAHNAAGATVVADNCATADAIATAAAASGPAGAELFPRELYRCMIIITENENGSCSIHEFGEVPW